MPTRSLSRELALLVLGQVPEQKAPSVADLSLDAVLDKALETLTQHWRESLDSSAADLEQAQQSLLDSELQQGLDSTHDYSYYFKNSFTNINEFTNWIFFSK